MSLNPTPAANLPSSDVPAWAFIVALGFLALTMLAGASMHYRCRDPRCPICGEGR